MTTASSGLAADSGRQADPPPPIGSPEWTACLEALLAGGEPRNGYETLLHRAADIGLYDVVRSWSMTDTPLPIDKPMARLLLPPEMLAALIRETAWNEDDLVAALATELPLAIRRYSTRQRFNRFGHTGCHGEDPVRR